jgi:chromosome partitioning protein
MMQYIENESFIVNTSVNNLWIIPSSVHLAGAEVELVSAEDREYRLKRLVSRVEASFDHIVIDCPPSLGLLTVNALAAADGVLVPMQCEYYALEGISHLIETIRLIKSTVNPNLELVGILMTMADMRTNLTTQVIHEARAFFKEKVFETVVPRSIRLSEAPSFGKPIALYDADSVGARKYRELAAELLARLQSGPPMSVGGMSRAAESAG